MKKIYIFWSTPVEGDVWSWQHWYTGVELDFGFCSKVSEDWNFSFSCMIGCGKWSSMPETPSKGLKPSKYYYYHNNSSSNLVVWWFERRICTLMSHLSWVRLSFSAPGCSHFRNPWNGKTLYIKKIINSWSKNFGYQESESESFRFSPGWSPGTHIILLLTDRLERME